MIPGSNKAMLGNGWLFDSTLVVGVKRVMRGSSGFRLASLKMGK
jgi:hypothetical protein